MHFTDGCHVYTHICIKTKTKTKRQNLELATIDLGAQRNRARSCALMMWYEAPWSRMHSAESKNGALLGHWHFQAVASRDILIIALFNELSAAHIRLIYRRIIGWLVNGKLKRMWKRQRCFKWRYYPCIFLEKLKKTTKKLRQDNRSQYRDLNLRPSEHGVGANHVTSYNDTPQNHCLILLNVNRSCVKSVV